MYQTSSQISGMVGGQMAMFANQSQFSQQIGGAVGTGPMAGGGGMQNPFPQTDMGSRIAGGMGMALPGVATGASIAGGLMGGAAGWADPMTGVARGFAGGAGAGGMGAMNTLGHIGKTFATGGMRAGMGVMAGGMAGAAAMALPYYAAGKAIQTVGQNIYAGAQNVAQVGQMSEHFGTQYGEAGSREGGKMGRESIKGIVGVLQNFASDDVKTTMGDLKKLMDQTGRMGMLTGISNPQEFKQKFGDIVGKVQAIAKMMGTTMEQAAPMLQEMGQMGLWKTSDILGTAMSGRVAGKGAGQMMESMQTGSQMSHAMGGSMRSGAMMGRENFMNIQAAQRAGSLSNEDIMEFTGGVGGAEGQKMMSQQMTGIMARFGQSSAGRLMMAGLGETRDGTFTGEIDKDKLEKFQRGEISVNELQAQGQKASRSREGAMSFFRQEGKLAQNMGSDGGMDSMMKIVQQVADTKFGGSEQARHQLIRQMFGVSNREAETIGKLVDDMPRIRDQRTKQFEDAVNQAFQEAERKQNASWDGFKDAVGQMWDESMRPLQDAGARLATDFGTAMDSASASLTGRVRRIAMGSGEKNRLLRQGALTQDLSDVGPENLGQSWLDAGPVSNSMMRMREKGFLSKAVGPGSIGGMAGIVNPLAGPMAGLAMTAGGFGEDMSPRAKALREVGVGSKGGGGNVDMGGGFSTSRTEMQQGIRRAFMRAQSPGSKNLSEKAKGKLADVKLKLPGILARHSKTLRDMDPSEKKKQIMRLLEKDGGLDGLSDMEKLDVVAAAQAEEGYESSELAIDFKAAAKDLGMMPENPEELAKMQNDALDAMTTAAGARNSVTSMLIGGAVGAAAGTLMGGPLGLVIGGALGAAGGAIYAAMGSDVNREMVERASTGPGADIFQAFAKSKMEQGDADKAKEALLKIKGGDEIIKIIDSVMENGAEAKAALKESSNTFAQTRMAQVGTQGRAAIRSLAMKQSSSVKGLSEENQEAFKSLVSKYQGKGGESDELLESGEAADAIRSAEELSGFLGKKEIKALREGGGAIGRQVAAFSKVGGVGEMGKDETQAFLKDMRQLGYDVEKFGGKETEQLLKDGKIKSDEVDKFTAALKKMVGSGLAGTNEAKKSSAERQLELLNQYTDANTKFVNAVNQALDGEVQSAANELKALQAEGQKQSPQIRGTPAASPMGTN